MASSGAPVADLAALSEHFETWMKEAERFKADPAIHVARDIASIEKKLGQMALAYETLATPTEVTNEEGAHWLLRSLREKHDAEVLYTFVEELAPSGSLLLTELLNMKKWNSATTRKSRLHKAFGSSKPKGAESKPVCENYEAAHPEPEAERTHSPTTVVVEKAAYNFD
ncbi:hypothetical protein PWT90_02021 [Aphanocladium album]|nr:hypothetical protein PWT90_02021 [Aphanocladium album]